MILHGIESPNIIRKNTLEDNIQEIQNKDRADVVLANPPFNQDKDQWWDASLEGDARWVYGTPPEGNGNYGWMQHMLYHTRLWCIVHVRCTSES